MKFLSKMQQQTDLQPAQGSALQGPPPARNSCYELSGDSSV